MKKYTLTSPITKNEFAEYYQLRYDILRKPWGQEKGSEQDELEDQSFHAMLVDEQKQILAAGRLHFNNNEEAQIRYMCVREDHQKQGLGQIVLNALEEKAKEENKNYIILNARENISNFYIKNGYIKIGDAATLYGTIKHIQMKKQL